MASLYPHLYRLSSQKDAIVAEILSFSSNSDLSWNLNFSRELLEREIPMVVHLTCLLNDVYVSSRDPNVRVWSLSSSSVFSIKSLFFSIVDENQNPSLVPVQSMQKSLAPLELRHFHRWYI